MRQQQHNKISKSMFELSDEEIYNLILNGNMRTFPEGFWEGEDGYIRAGRIVKYLVEEVLKWDEETLIQKYSKKILTENKLKSILDKVFDGDEIEAILAAYPDIKYRRYEALKKLKELAFTQEEIPSKSKITELYSEDMIKFFFRSFQNLNLTLKNNYSRQELIDILKEKKRKLGKNPTNLDMKVPQAIIFIREFDTYHWDEILKKAGLE